MYARCVCGSKTNINCIKWFVLSLFNLILNYGSEQQKKKNTHTYTDAHTLPSRIFIITKSEINIIKLKKKLLFSWKKC